MRWSNPTDMVLRTFRLGPGEGKQSLSVCILSKICSLNWSSDLLHPVIRHQSSLSAHTAEHQHPWLSQAALSGARGRHPSPTGQTVPWKSLWYYSCNNHFKIHFKLTLQMYSFLGLRLFLLHWGYKAFGHSTLSGLNWGRGAKISSPVYS